MDRIPQIDLVLAGAVAVAALAGGIVGRRGGAFRGLARWAGFWAIFAALLIVLSRATRWLSFPLLALFMFGALRAYFSVAPVRPRDRYAVLATYLAIPFALWPAFNPSEAVFLATVPVALFLVIPVFLAYHQTEPGLLDAMGRTLLGVLFFVFCIAHLGLLVHEPQAGLLEMFGVLVLAAELPQRLMRHSDTLRTFAFSVVAGLLLAGAAGYLLGPSCQLVEEDAARAGVLVAVAVTLGTRVSVAVMRDLSLSSSSARFGRGASLNYIIPAVYAAPVYFHYLNTFA